MKLKAQILIGAVVCFALAGCREPVGRPPSIVADRNVAVPMRDGVILRADVLRPKAAGKFPVLVYRTPYGKHEALQYYKTFEKAVARGYAVVVQDVRGRYASDGEFVPYQNEGKDGYDTIEWAATQSWSNGAVGTFGLSYPGAVQWLAAVENPPHLKAMVPAMTFSTPQNFFYAGGAFDLSWIDWIWNNIAPNVRTKKNLSGPRTDAEAAAEWKAKSSAMLARLPLNAMDELRAAAPYYYEWMWHAPEDPWWEWCELRGKYGRTQAAVLNLSGWYDDNYGPEGATTNFRGLVAARSEKAERTALMLGPWTHGDQEIPKAGDRSFPANAAIDYDELILRWMDRYVRGIDNGVDREKAVRYYVMGRNEWQESEAWPPVASAKDLFLWPAAEVSGGLLSFEESPQAGRAGAHVPPSIVESDPEHPVTDPFSVSGGHDYQSLVGKPGTLTFDSEPLQDDLEVTGQIEGIFYVSCNCRDADLWARLYDVAPDGTTYNLMSPGLDLQRISYRDVAKGRQLMTPGQVYEVRLKNLITSNVFLKGHRLRVIVTGAFAPHFSRNLQSGESEVVSKRAQRATLKIYHDVEHRSRFVLPVIKAPN